MREHSQETCRMNERHSVASLDHVFCQVHGGEGGKDEDEDEEKNDKQGKKNTGTDKQLKDKKGKDQDKDGKQDCTKRC